ncbi:hypothetical protein K1T71_006250 [Dendrolimus kikuchii]|uniref:Uncharacterized protein n=1 Tax=Dendrolimus kikuchii TaxID=765133 RepID=A0ACC1D3L7_9NEOP|nr:hypothetical protein K1T71_006250 [Dendrolimus kikuchii]
MDRKNELIYSSFKRRYFSKINEKVQSKYIAMQQKLEKSRSVDSLPTLEKSYVINEQRYASNYDIKESDELIHIKQKKADREYDKQTVIIENVSRNDANIEYFDYEEANISDSEAESIPNEKQESNAIISNKFFGNTFSKTSLESLNEVAGESDGYLTPSTPSPPPRISIRNKIGSRITAAREKRRVGKERIAAAKDVKKEYSGKVEKLLLSNTTKQDIRLFKKWRVATVTIALIEATGFENENPEEKLRILFCRLRLGNEKYKSKSLKSNTSQFKWQELCTFNMYDDNILEISLWDKDVVLGRSFTDLNKIEKEKTHRMRITMEGEMRNVKIFILLTISGLPVVNTLVDFDDYQETQRRLSTIRRKFAWYQISNDLSGVGWLSVIVYGAKGLSGHDCHCILELDNERRQTYTESKTNEPNWMKIFDFTVTDITSILEVTVHDEKRSEDVGKLSIPLLSVNKFKKKWYALKDASQRDRARGNNPRILLEIIISWNLARAAIKVVNPKEINLIEPEEKLDRHLLARNLSRAKAILTWTFNAFQIVKTCFEWESRELNMLALILWLLFCWFFKIWMLPLLLLVPFAIYRPSNFYLINCNLILITFQEEKNTSLRQKIQSLQEMMQSVQNFIGKFATLGESIKNLFNFTVPFLSFLAIFFIVMIAFIMYIVPTKYMFMIWGIHKFTRKILRPNRIPNNEILDLLSRVPDDEKLLDFEDLSLENVPEEDVIK